MSFLKRFFGADTNKTQDNIYHNGDKIPCGECGKELKVQYYPKGKIFTGGIDSFRGIALRCQKCGFITCIECAMKPMAGMVQACPSCKEMLGPTVLTEGIDVLHRP